MVWEGLVAKDTINKNLEFDSFVVKQAEVEEPWQNSYSDDLLFSCFISSAILWNLTVLDLMDSTQYFVMCEDTSPLKKTQYIKQL